MAAQAGVRYSITNPESYVSTNINGFFNILEISKILKVKHFVYASSSSVYGISNKTPFSENIKIDKPLSLYAASKSANELMAHAYSNINSLPCTGLRFFTVYGPWGRPDMAYFKFVENIINNKPIDIYGNGKMSRDFTYIDDVCDVLKDLINITPVKRSENAYVPHEIYNVGNNKPEMLEYFISVIESELGKKAIRNYMPMQKGDVINTFANIDKIKSKTSFHPKTNIEKGINKFVRWYIDFYKI